jgi:two-component system phosphate regulon sensor histidine kinase PhoR
MSRQRIRWIVALMAIGLLGLIGLQSYWISSALELQKKQFDYKITDALQEVVRTLERQEILYLTRQRIQTREKKERLMAISRKDERGQATDATSAELVHSSPASAASTQKQLADQQTQRLAGKRTHAVPNAGGMVVQSDVLHPMVQPLTPEQAAVVEAFFRQQDELMAVGDWQTQLVQQQQFSQWLDGQMDVEIDHINEQVAEKKRHKDSVNQQKRLLAQREQVKPDTDSARVVSRPASMSSSQASEQTRWIKDVLNGLMLSDRPIEDRVNRLVLDTLLRQTLQDRGINIPFAFGVRTKAQPKFLFTSTGMDTQHFNESGYRAVLFPNNMIESGNYLYVYFPTQRAFILNQLGFTLGASVLLIAVILACFYIAINTIVQQKKLADIKNDFINNMTHEFKTPISTISLAAEMAQEQVGRLDGPTADATGLNERVTRYMGIIRDETRRLGSHVEKVLQMALLDRGEIRLKLSPVNIHDVIEKVLNNIGIQIEQRGGEVDLSFDADQEVIEADELHVTNILYNLLDNALKYSPDTPKIGIKTASLPDGVSITVSDEGLGMTKEQVSRIFEKFYRVPTGNRHDVKGFGLGLSYVKKMVDEHHGQILVNSQPGKGSTFEVILPYKIVDE